LRTGRTARSAGSRSSWCLISSRATSIAAPPRAFASDRRAQELALEGIEAGMDTHLSFGQRHFFYMPLMHAEDPELQRLSMERFNQLKSFAEQLLVFARDHQSEIERFG